MDTQSDKPKRKPIVIVEFQTEVDIATSNHEKRMFAKCTSMRATTDSLPRSPTRSACRGDTSAGTGQGVRDRGARIENQGEGGGGDAH
jgi:hypothetical protein